MRTRRTLYFAIATLVLGGIGAIVYLWSFVLLPSFIAESIKSAPPPTETVSAEEARNENWQPRIAAIGTLTATDGIDIAPQVGGVVDMIAFESGKTVRKGELLLRLDFAAEAAEMRSITAQLVNAEADLARRESLAAKGYAPRSQIDELRSQRDSLQASVDRLRAIIAQKFIYAPWDGRLGLRNLSIGSYVAAGQRVVWLQHVDPIFADFAVTEEEYGRIAAEQKVTARFNAWPGEVFTGKVVTTDARMSDASRMITVRAEIANPDGRLLPGMYANVEVAAGTPAAVITVPQTAVTFSLYGDNVFVVVPASKSDPKAKPDDLVIERRFVKVGEIREGRVAVRDGINLGERVVTAGQNKIDQGSHVVVNNSIALQATGETELQ
ncbi:MAG: efflux RND transporter periplasmic adaptor subunit [Alphaproteobacteria bacterium]|nr:efflux RND transporter periplasmic adaptor subunit [Alphaproteobacteria bacterium]